MIPQEFNEYVVGMTAQTNRISLIFQLIRSLTKLAYPINCRFFDLHHGYCDKSATDPDLCEYVLCEPLDPTKRIVSLKNMEGLAHCIRKQYAEAITQVPIQNGEQLRFVFKLFYNSKIKSVLVVDFTADQVVDIETLQTFWQIFCNLQETIRAKDQDPLTGLFNRRSFDETISQILDSISPQHQPNRSAGDGACLAVFDLDHFKRINDLFGHAIGDEVLILFSQQMERMFRADDILYRFGGEEFLAILVEVTPEKAFAALDRFRRAIEEQVFPQVDKVTVSIGFVMVKGQDYPPVLIEKADKSLYYSKENGRNQVNSYETLVEQNKLAEIEHSSTDIEIWD